MLGFAAGVMLAASFWSLLAPAIEMSKDLGKFSFVPALVGFLLGGIFLRVIDRIIPHLHFGFPEQAKEGPKTSLRKSILLVLSITIHNIPEGAAVGVAFGAVITGDTETLITAIVLALGIGIQNFPEGAAVSIPLRGEGLSRGKSFWYGQLSAVVEPIFRCNWCCIGCFCYTYFAVCACLCSWCNDFRYCRGINFLNLK